MHVRKCPQPKGFQTRPRFFHGSKKENGSWTEVKLWGKLAKPWYTAQITSSGKRSLKVQLLKHNFKGKHERMHWWVNLAQMPTHISSLCNVLEMASIHHQYISHRQLKSHCHHPPWPCTSISLGHLHDPSPGKVVGKRPWCQAVVVFQIWNSAKSPCAAQHHCSVYSLEAVRIQTELINCAHLMRSQSWKEAVALHYKRRRYLEAKETYANLTGHH